MNRIWASLSIVAVASTLASQPSPGKSVSPAPSPLLFSSDQISEMQDIVSDGRYRSVFGGLAGDPSLPDSHVITIYVAPSADPAILSVAKAALSTIGAANDPKLGYEPKPWTVQYQTVGPSLAVLDGVVKQVASAEPWSTDVRDYLVSYGIDPNIHAVRVKVTSITQKIADEAQHSFGNLVTLEVGTRPHLTAETGQQDWDGQPYYGGDRISPGCTSGFAAYDQTARTYGFVTAGHCGPAIGQSVQQGTGGTFTGTLGIVTIQSNSNNTVDAEFVDGSRVGTSVDADVNTPAAQGVNVKTTGSSFVNLSLCIDGGYSGENCSGTVTQTNICVTFTDLIRRCYLNQVVAPQTAPALCQPGDSGSPWYTRESYGLSAYGIHTGGDDPHTCYYSEISQIMSRLGVSIVTNGLIPQAPSPLGDTIQNQVLNPNQYMSSSQLTANGVRVYKYMLDMQGTDGNLVLYAPGGSLWASNTAGNPNAVAAMGPDGNLVVYSASGTVLWATNTGSPQNNGSRLVVQGDGNLVMYRPNNTVVWATNTCCYRP